MNIAGPSQNPSISSLPSATKSKLRSTQILTSLPQLVSELVQNSLDACARNVDISVDPEDWECFVRDDGTGISRDGLAVLAYGPESGRYGTSKAHTLASLSQVTTFGFRGEALASVADLCCLEISSRTKHSSESWSIILKGAQTLYSGPSVRWRRGTPGTVVSVRDAFYNLPIRRRSHPSPARTLELVRKNIESFALVFPNVCFSLENTQKTKEGSHVRAKTRPWIVPKTSSTLATFRHLYGKALADHVEEINESCGDMRLEGFISLEGAHSKAYQYLYVNKHPLEACDLHRSIESVFARSSFNKHAYDECGATTTPRSRARRSPRRTEKRPVYVLNLTIPPVDLDNCVNSAKTAVQLQNSASVLSFLSSVVESVLLRHGFLSLRSHQSRLGNGSPSPRKKRKSAHASEPIGLPQAPRASLVSSQPISATTDTQRLSRHGSAPVAMSGSLSTVPEDDVVVGEHEEASDILWTDPATGETFVIDARTGNSYPRHGPVRHGGEDACAAPFSTPRRSLGARDVHVTGEAPVWITEALRANEVYRLTERTIPALTSLVDLTQRHTSARSAASQLLTPWDASSLGRFGRDGLRKARVLGQVDQKFIACVISTSSSAESALSDAHREGGALVLIDQHAADERVRVERFLREICEGFLSHCVQPPYSGHESERKDGVGVRTRTVEPPANILLTRPEAERVIGSRDVRGAFARWGVAFANPSESLSSGYDATHDPAYVQATVTTVPEVVADKLLAGNELRDFVKGFLATLDIDGAEDAPSTGEDNNASGWQKALRWCPKELVELINSKACRGAVMFNDRLSREQCQDLVMRLAETDLPFQCAHGRPSLVPLVDTGSAECLVESSRRINWGEFMRLGPVA